MISFFICVQTTDIYTHNKIKYRFSLALHRRRPNLRYYLMITIIIASSHNTRVVVSSNIIGKKRLVLYSRVLMPNWRKFF